MSQSPGYEFGLTVPVLLPALPAATTPSSLTLILPLSCHQNQAFITIFAFWPLHLPSAISTPEAGTPENVGSSLSCGRSEGTNPTRKGEK